MKHKRNSLAGLLLAVLVLIGAALMVGFHSPIGWISLLTAAPFVFGTVTVTTQWPLQSTVPPTVAQMKPLSLCTAQIVFSSDSDTQALITHNMNLGSVQLPTAASGVVSEISCLFPLASWYYTAGGSNTTILLGSIVSSAVFAITKLSAASSAGTVNAFVLRPWTGIR